MSRSDRGQATVELALALPVVLLALLIVVQAALVVRAQLLVVHAARATARVASTRAVGEPADVARRAAPGLGSEGLTVEVSGPAGDPPMVVVSVRKVVRTSVPLVGPLLGDVTVEGTAAMPSEAGDAAEPGHPRVGP